MGSVELGQVATALPFLRIGFADAPVQIRHFAGTSNHYGARPGSIIHPLVDSRLRRGPPRHPVGGQFTLISNSRTGSLATVTSLASSSALLKFRLPILGGMKDVENVDL